MNFCTLYPPIQPRKNNYHITTSATTTTSTTTTTATCAEMAAFIPAHEMWWTVILVLSIGILGMIFGITWVCCRQWPRTNSQRILFTPGFEEKNEVWTFLVNQINGIQYFKCTVFVFSYNSSSGNVKNPADLIWSRVGNRSFTHCDTSRNVRTPAKLSHRARIRRMIRASSHLGHFSISCSVGVWCLRYRLKHIRRRSKLNLIEFIYINDSINYIIIYNICVDINITEMYRPMEL